MSWGTIMETLAFFLLLLPLLLLLLLLGPGVAKWLRPCATSRKGPWIDPRWCHLGFFPWYLPTKPCALRSTQPLKMSTRDSPGVKAASAFGWRPTTLVVPKVEKIRGLNLPGTPWAISACRGIPLLYLLLLLLLLVVIVVAFPSECHYSDVIF